MSENQKRNSLERKKRPWTIMIPRNAVQTRGEEEDGEEVSTARDSVLIFNTPDGQPLDLKERDSFLEALRKHAEGKGDASSLIAPVGVQPKEGEVKKGAK